MGRLAQIKGIYFQLVIQGKSLSRKRSVSKIYFWRIIVRSGPEVCNFWSRIKIWKWDGSFRSGTEISGKHPAEFRPPSGDFRPYSFSLVCCVKDTEITTTNNLSSSDIKGSTILFLRLGLLFYHRTKITKER
jgi:hypothetical protein